MTAPSYVEELRLTAFKSFHNEVLPLSELTLIIGRNGSGKSNALDALEVLSKLAQGEDIRDALEGGRRDAAAVRGGVEGCAPQGTDQFSIGCRVRTGDEVVDLDVTVQVRPQVQIVAETICGRGGGRQRSLMYTGEVDPERSDIAAQYWNNKQGADPKTHFRSSRLLATQIATRVPTSPAACKTVHRAAEQVLEALRGVFVLDPVPHLMRQYVPERDTVLRRQGENLSAVIGHLKRSDRVAFEQLVELLRSLPEQRVKQLLVERSSLGDVMIALAESQNKKKIVVPARLMSDGMLRFLAFSTALLDAPLVVNDNVMTIEADTIDVQGQTTLVIEEVENGLHPTQAARIVDLIKTESQRRRIRTIATTHSPAMLSALDGDDHEGVVVCDRDPNGRSRLRRLTELPGYAAAMAAGSLGDAVTTGRIAEAASPRRASYSRFDQLLKGR